ncbi:MULTISPECIES: DNA cytosine methyltransferase [Asanoa]|uniref:DNA (Cytosine-5)-methyltransferase 1 n=2 Tax=Asanoa TaxID=195964 RepID=A0A239PFA4_9ACTN|nr:MULTISPECIES: DNA cytosine methyltransferase [Asanoa]GIF74157.1 DNA cytosine methyltransferase [Asanoa siamensis]SNT65673.1 DNA (cytosine-5)-methyltransferase 1 [Asanoa hainanensis]
MITHYSEFSGLGGTDHGVHFIGDGFGDRFRTWIETTDAANHDADACEQHELNFPNARHYQQDVTKLDMTTMPRVDLFTSSPACPGWTDSRGIKRDFDKANAEQTALFEMPGAKQDDPQLQRRIKQYKRSRLLMNEIPRYLRAMIERNPREPVLIGMMENVVQCRLWAEWDRWILELRNLGYYVRLIAFNAMHARPVRAPWAGQSRNRLFVGFWHRSLGRHPDWDKWLRPKAWCDNCVQIVDAVQVFKKPGVDMGSYGRQYIYQCPQLRCRGREVFPEVVPALSAIDLSNPGVRIGDREARGMKALQPATTSRIEAGKVRHWGPLLVPTGASRRGHGDQGAVPLTTPTLPRTTRESDSVDLPPLLVPVEGRPDKTAAPATGPMRTQTTRAETGVAMPFITPLRGGGSKTASYPVTQPAGTVTASGNHHGLVLPPAFLMRNNTGGAEMCTPVDEPARTVTTAGHQSLVTWQDALLVPYYGAAESAIPAAGPSGALTTRDRYGLALPPQEVLTELPDLADIYFRMLLDYEIGKLMGFHPSYRNEAKTQRARVRLYGNAVVAACAELIVSALVECMTGAQLEREYALAA